MRYSLVSQRCTGSAAAESRQHGVHRTRRVVMVVSVSACMPIMLRGRVFGFPSRTGLTYGLMFTDFHTIFFYAHKSPLSRSSSLMLATGPELSLMNHRIRSAMLNTRPPSAVRQPPHHLLGIICTHGCRTCLHEPHGAKLRRAVRAFNLLHPLHIAAVTMVPVLF